MVGESKEEQGEGGAKWVDKDKAANVDVTQVATKGTGPVHLDKLLEQAEEDQGSINSMGPKGFAWPLSGCDCDSSHIYF